jgi:hypothetical protein
LQLGVLGSCLTPVFLIQAADQGIPLDSLDVEVTGQMDGRAGQPGYEDVPSSRTTFVTPCNSPRLPLPKLSRPCTRRWSAAALF